MGLPSLPPSQPAKAARWLHWLPALLAAAFLLLLLPKIAAGTLWHHDELLTANRAREMLVRGDPFAVTINFAPNVKKPPLQYWLCAGLLSMLPGHPELAVRLPTLLGGAACLLAVAVLAKAWFPEEEPAFAVWCAVVLFGCGYLIHFSRVGLLDTNAALLLTLFLISYQRAQQDARQWWLAALFCVLGAWQKAPYGLAAWLLLFVSHRLPIWQNTSLPTIRRWPGHLPCALAVAVLGSLGWWAIQWLLVDSTLLLASGQEQIGSFLRAHDPADQGFRPWLYWAWMARDWALPGLCAPIAVVAAIWAGRRHLATVQFGGLCLLFGGTLACLTYRAERYLVVITPLLAVLIVHVVRQWSRALPGTWKAWVLPLLCASTLPAACFQVFKPSPGNPDLMVVTQALDRTSHAKDQIFVCTDADPNFEVANFVLFYAKLPHPLKALTEKELSTVDLSKSSRGLCNSAQWPRLSKAQNSLQAVAKRGNWIVWTNQK